MVFKCIFTFDVNDHEKQVAKAKTILHKEENDQCRIEIYDSKGRYFKTDSPDETFSYYYNELPKNSERIYYDLFEGYLTFHLNLSWGKDVLGLSQERSLEDIVIDLEEILEKKEILEKEKKNFLEKCPS